MHSQSATHNNGQATEVLARQGLRLPQIVLKRLRDAGIYCQPTVSVEHQNLAKRYVVRGVESGGAVADLGAYSSFAGECGETLAWLQRVDSIGVNGVHAIVVAPVLIRLQMLRIARTYDLLITRHSLASVAGNARPQLESSILFYGRRGSLEMELWGNDARVPRSGLARFLHPGRGSCDVAKRLPRCCGPNHICRVLPRLPSLSFARTKADCPARDGGSQRA